MQMQDKLIVENLKTYYYSRSKVVPAVDGVSFTVDRGEVLGIVGESGCGKSTVVRSVLGLIDKSYTRIEEGRVLLNGQSLLDLSEKELNKIRGKAISMIFQNPLSSLNPVYTVGSQIVEILKIHENISKEEAKKRAVGLMRQVGIPAPESRFYDYPHQLSGGMQQRILIAIALACNPRFLIADEPTTALDVTIQAQILDLIADLCSRLNMGVILITHNMGVVAEICDRILVMYGGVTVEEGRSTDVFASPRHPYTRGLLDSIPTIKEDKEQLYSIPGQIPAFEAPVGCCRYASRCARVFDKCGECEPPLFELEHGQKARCWLYENVSPVTVPACPASEAITE